MIITIDGPAAAGKGTLAQKLAEKYKLAYFDTGMVYRAVGIDLISREIDPNNVFEAEKAAHNMSFSKMIKLSERSDFRSEVGSLAASMVAALPNVRSALLKMQQDFALNPLSADGKKMSGVVYDGRDTGTTVCPNADIKLFITASPEVRAWRRHKEYLQKGMLSSYDEVLAQTKERDLRDSSRASSPLKPAKDAVIIDTSNMDSEEVFKMVCQIVDKR